VKGTSRSALPAPQASFPDSTTVLTEKQSFHPSSRRKLLFGAGSLDLVSFVMQSFLSWRSSALKYTPVVF